MRLQAKTRTISRIAAVAATAAVPGALWAGSYGSAGVKDATVTNQTSTALVWCQKVRADVPIALLEQMDCGAGDLPAARPAVAPERFTTNDRGGLFSFFRDHPHQPEGPVADNGDGPPLVIVTVTEDGPEPTPTPTPTAATPTKWERLGELGVTKENYNAQGQDFVDQVSAYLSEHGRDGDWSGFNPK